MSRFLWFTVNIQRRLKTWLSKGFMTDIHTTSLLLQFFINVLIIMIIIILIIILINILSSTLYVMRYRSLHVL